MKTERTHANSSDTAPHSGTHRRSSLTRRLIAWFLVVALVPLTVVSAVSYYTAKESLRQVAYESLYASVEEKAAFIKNWFHYRLIDLEAEANAIQNASLLVELQEAYKSSGKALGEFVKSYRWHAIVEEQANDLKTFCKLYEYHDVFLVDIDGNILFTVAAESDLGTNLFDGPLAETRFASVCRKALDTGQASFSDLEYSGPSNNVYAGFFAQAILDEAGERIGLFAFQITSEQIEYIMGAGIRQESAMQRYIIGVSREMDGITLRSALMDHESTGNTARIQDAQTGGFVSDWGRPVDTEQSRLWFGEHGPSGIQDEHQQETAFVYDDPSGVSVLGIHKSVYLADVKWGVIAEIPEVIAFAPVRRLKNMVIGLVVVTGILVVIVAVSTTRRIVRPIRNLSRAASLVAEGDLSQAIDSDATDEIGDLSRCFNRMVANLGNLFGDLSNQKYALDEHAIVSITDIKGAITFVNDKFCKISGYTRQELIGQNHRMVKSDEHTREFYRNL